MTLLREALRFLTMLPLPGVPDAKHDLARALPWFPVAGLVIGLLLLPVGWLAGWLWDDLVRAALLVVAWASLTGGLHLDGLSDTFDAVLSWRPRARKLEIMRDSRIGTLGALALGAVLLLKVAWLHAAGAGWWQALLVAVIWGRWAMLASIFWFPPARADGLAHGVQGRVGHRAFALATLAALLLAGVLGGWQGLAAGLLVWSSTYALAHWWVRDLGGLTGDTYGALCELGEVVALAALTV